MFSSKTYKERRDKLCKKINNRLLLFLGNGEAAFNYADNTYRFRQDSTFLYLFGLDFPDLAATVDTSTGETTIYGNDVSIDDIVWTGPVVSISEMAQLTGADKTRRLDDLPTAIRKPNETLFVTPYRDDTKIWLGELLGMTPRQTTAAASRDLMRAIAEMRLVKEPQELAEMQQHSAVGNAMHIAAMQMAHEGTSEQQIMAALENISLRGGGAVSFPTICTVHGETLHNHGYSNTLRNGDLLLVDAGSESPNHYATDNTRTSPVGGLFSNKQKEIYDIVLQANNAVRKNAKPGLRYADMHLLAAKTITQGLTELGLMKGDTEESVANGAYALFMPHGIGHALGLDVHDMENYGEDLIGYDDKTTRRTDSGLAPLRFGRHLQENFCVTDEPGIYFIPELINRWEASKKCSDFINFSKLHAYYNFGGIRIEDDLVITHDGCNVIGDRLPATTNEVENVVRSHSKNIANN